MNLNPEVETLKQIENIGALFSTIRYILGDSSMLDKSTEEDKKEMDTFGNLVDKLVTVNLKMWHNQEDLYAIRRMTPEQFDEKYGKDLKTLHKIIDRCCTLNVQRANLMDEIDRFLVEAIASKKEAKDLVREQCKMY
jgi:DNA-binding ferritin-like protein (Dps family)